MAAGSLFRMHSCLLAAALACLTACTPASPYRGMNMSSHNTVALAPVCIGQFILQFPSQGASDWSTNVDWAEVERLPSRLHDHAGFWAHVHGRRDALASQHHDSELSLLYHYEIMGDNAALLLHRGEDTNVIAYYLERYLWLGDRGYLFKGLGEGEEIKAKLPGYKRIFTKLEPIDQYDQSGGFCIDGAMVETPIEEISASLSIRPAGLPATWLYISSAERATVGNDVAADDPRAFSAIGRMEMDRDEFNELRSYRQFKDLPDFAKKFDVVRAGSRSVAGRIGEEAVWREVTNDGAIHYRFLWLNADGLPTLHSNPSLLLEMRSGNEMKPGSTPVSEKALLSLWDAVLDSVEKRG